MRSRAYVDKFNRALYALAVQEGDVRSRLESAYTVLRRVRIEDVPEKHREELTKILQLMISKGPSEERFYDGTPMKDAIANTMSRMKNKTARKIAERIYAMTTDALGF